MAALSLDDSSSDRYFDCAIPVNIHIVHDQKGSTLSYSKMQNQLLSAKRTQERRAGGNDGG